MSQQQIELIRSSSPDNVSIEQPDEILIDEESNQKPVKTKLRFPILTSKLLQQAINQNLLSYEKKDSIIRDPNIHTVLQFKFDLDSPRTSNALQSLNISKQDLKLIDYQDFYNKKEKPLPNLLNYLKYITDIYKVWTSVLKLRNQQKKDQTRAKKINRSKDIRFTHMKDNSIVQRSESYDQSTLLTEVPIKFQKILRGEEESFQVEQPSIEKSRSSILGSSILSSEEKKVMFDKKQENQEKNMSKFFQMALNHLAQKEQFYSQTLPETLKKIEMKKEEYIKKISLKMKKQTQRVYEIQEKNLQKEKVNIKGHSEKIKKMEENLQRHVEKKRELIHNQMSSLSEARQQQQQLEAEREMRRQYFVDEEEEMMQNVLLKLEKKKKLFIDYQTQKKEKEETKKQQFEENLSKRVLEVKKRQKTLEVGIWADFLQREGQRQVQLSKHEQVQLKVQRDFSLKHLKQLKKIEKHQEIQEDKFKEQLNRFVGEGSEKQSNVLQRHSSLIELRKLKMIKKNQIRQQQAKLNYINQMLNMKKEQDVLLKKSIQITERNERTKKENEELHKYKIVQLQEQGEMMNSLLQSEKF